MDYAQSMGVGGIRKNKLNMHFVQKSIISSRIGPKVVKMTIKNKNTLNTGCFKKKGTLLIGYKILCIKCTCFSFSGNLAK